MANTSYLKVVGETQGEMKGDCTQDGRTDRILVYAVDHSVEIPTDNLTGLPTGQRVHRPMEIIKRKDMASPLLFQACCNGEQITELQLDHYRVNASGQEENYFTILLERAVVVKMVEYTPMALVPENKPFYDMERVLFSYEKITWTYNDGGITAIDDWKTPNVA